MIGLLGILFIALGVGFLLDPAQAASRLGVGPLGPLGLSTLRGDFFAFFGAGGLLSAIAAIRKDARLLTAPLLLIAMALAGRLVTVVASGFDAAMAPPCWSKRSSLCFWCSDAAVLHRPRLDRGIPKLYFARQHELRKFQPIPVASIQQTTARSAIM
jgi:hypothetical protein